MRWGLGVAAAGKRATPLPRGPFDAARRAAPTSGKVGHVNALLQAGVCQVQGANHVGADGLNLRVQGGPKQGRRPAVGSGTWCQLA